MAESNGISIGSLSVTGGTVTGRGGTATAAGTDSAAYGNGIYAETLTVTGGTVTGTAASATAAGEEGYAESYGIYAYETIAVNGGTVTGTATSAAADGEGGESCSYGIGADELEVARGVVTGKGGNASADGVKGEAESHGIDVGRITIDDGAVTGTAADATANGANGEAKSRGIDTGDLTVKSGTVTGTAASATANGADGKTKSYGVNTDKLTVDDGTVTGTAASATADGEARSHGIDVSDLATVNGGVVTGKAGAAAANDKARSRGIDVSNLTVTGGTVTGTAASATADGEEGVAKSYGVNTGELVISGGAVTGTGGSASADEDNGYAKSSGVDADELTVTGGTVTGIGGTATDVVYDVYVTWNMTVSKGTVKSGREDGALRLTAEPLVASGGEIKLTEGSLLYAAEVSDGVTLADLLVDGCAYSKIKCVSIIYFDEDSWENRDYYTDEEYTETDEGFVTLDGLTALEDEYTEVEDEANYAVTATWYKYLVKSCTHSTTSGVCAYCGEDVTPAAPQPTPASTVETVKNKLGEISGTATESEIREAVQDIGKSDLTQALEESDDVVDKLKELESNVSGSVSIVVTRNAANAGVSRSVDIVGVKLNDLAADGKDIVLTIDTARESKTLPKGISAKNAVHLTINLEGVENPHELAVPVCLTIEVPKGMDAKRICLVHYAEGAAEPEILRPTVYQEGGKWYARFVIGGFSHFVLAEQEVAETTATATKPAQSPRTGDEASVALWLALATVSAMGVALVAGKKKVQ